MVGDAEAVSLVTQVTDHPEGLGGLVEEHGQAVAGIIDLFQPLGNADDGDLAPQPQLLQTLQGGAQLSLTSIDHNELRKGFFLLQQALVSSFNDLLHRSKIIRSFHRTNIIMSVFFLSRTCIFKTYHGRHRVITLQVRIIKAFDMLRQNAHAKIFLHGIHDPAAMALRVGKVLPFLFLKLIIFCIPLR